MPVKIKGKADKTPDLAHIVESLRPLAVKLSTIKPNPNNAREHSVENVREIAGSMKEFGWDVPLVVNEKSRVLVKGHGRYLAAVKVNHWSYGPVVWVQDEDPESIARAIADNAVGDTSRWNRELLAVQLPSQQVGDAALAALFSRLQSEATQAVAKAAETVTEEVNYLEDMELKPTEHYDFIVVLATNVKDWNVLCDKLGLEDVYSKVTKKRIGLGRAISAEKLLGLLK